MSLYSDTHLLKVERFGDVIDLSPDLNPVNTSFGIPIVIIKIKGMSFTSEFPFRHLYTSTPSSPGIMTSSKIRSVFKFRMSPRELYAERELFPRK